MLNTRPSGQAGVPVFHQADHFISSADILWN